MQRGRRYHGNSTFLMFCVFQRANLPCNILSCSLCLALKFFKYVTDYEYAHLEFLIYEFVYASLCKANDTV